MLSCEIVRKLQLQFVIFYFCQIKLARKILCQKKLCGELPNSAKNLNRLFLFSFHFVSRLICLIALPANINFAKAHVNFLVRADRKS